MKKTILILTLNVIVTFTLFGQVNPIRNLNWALSFAPITQAMCCDSLSWNEPIPSLTDTLVGYNIYQSNHLFEFTIDTLNFCNPCTGETSSTFCNFMNYIGPGYWYIHVTAVYNQAHIESTYNDSIYWNFGMWPIGIKEIANVDFNISNIIQDHSSTLIELNQAIDSGMLLISNCLGQETMKIILHEGQQEINFNSPDPGFYLLSLKTNKGNIVRKIIIK
jgi:hypothetical protein